MATVDALATTGKAGVGLGSARTVGVVVSVMDEAGEAGGVRDGPQALR
jgi:hypothetical protein